MRILVVGGTGLVGKNLLQQLSDMPQAQVVALVRRSGSLKEMCKNLTERVFDFDNAESYHALSQESFDVVFCCLGTTRKKAGSAPAFRKVDFEYPLCILENVKTGNPVFCVISSIGANKPFGLYLKTKFEVERAVFSSGLRYVIVRPSLLLGDREEFRLAEAMFAKLVRPLSSIWAHALGKSVARYAPIEAAQVARIMIANTCIDPPVQGGKVLEGRALFAK